jgi:hypothetical protein
LQVDRPFVGEATTARYGLSHEARVVCGVIGREVRSLHVNRWFGGEATTATHKLSRKARVGLLRHGTGRYVDCMGMPPSG